MSEERHVSSTKDEEELNRDWMNESRNPRHRPNLNDFKEASERLKGVILRTPLIPLRRYKEEDTGIYLKPESLQPIGSYKIRGVYNWVARLGPEERARGISTLSTGNMAQAVGYVANLFSIPSRIAISDKAPLSKVDACRRYGSEIDRVKLGDEILRNAEALAHGFCFIHPTEEYGLMDGYGTIGLEILEDAIDVDTIYAPTGAGFLSCGVALAAKAVKPQVRVVGVNAENCPHYYESLRKGKPTTAAYKPSLADGIAAPFTPSQGNFELVRDALDEVVLVPEEEIRRAIRLLAVENKLVVEGAGAISLAAAISAPKSQRGKTVCVISGGSIDAAELADILENN